MEFLSLFASREHYICRSFKILPVLKVVVIGTSAVGLSGNAPLEFVGKFTETIRFLLYAICAFEPFANLVGVLLVHLFK